MDFWLDFTLHYGSPFFAIVVATFVSSDATLQVLELRAFTAEDC
jgi:hypothetical protein